MVYPAAFMSEPGAVLRLTGEDHVDFLHNQGTRDLRGPEGFCRYTLWLDHQGRVHGDAFVLKLDADSMLVVSYQTTASLLVEKFERHIVADDVEIEDLTRQWMLLSLPPGDPPAVSRTDFEREADGWRFPGLRLGPGTVDLLRPRSAEAVPVDQVLLAPQAERRRLEAGLPAIPADTDGALLGPLELGLGWAVSFDKGCFLGQEVVARQHRLQRLPRRLVRVSGAGAPPAVPFDCLVQGQRAGRLTSASETDGGFLALGWLKARFAGTDLQLDDRADPLTVEDLTAR